MPVSSPDPHVVVVGSGRSGEGHSTCCGHGWMAERRPSQLGGKPGLGVAER